MFKAAVNGAVGNAFVFLALHALQLLLAKRPLVRGFELSEEMAFWLTLGAIVFLFVGCVFLCFALFRFAESAAAWIAAFLLALVSLPALLWPKKETALPPLYRIRYK